MGEPSDDSVYVASKIDSQVKPVLIQAKFVIRILPRLNYPLNLV